MVGQHDPACADADPARTRSDMADHDGGCGARDADHVVVLGQPVARVAPLLRVLGQVESIAQGIGRRGPDRNGSKIEYGEGLHRQRLSWTALAWGYLGPRGRE